MGDWLICGSTYLRRQGGAGTPGSFRASPVQPDGPRSCNAAGRAVAPAAARGGGGHCRMPASWPSQQSLVPTLPNKHSLRIPPPPPPPPTLSLAEHKVAARKVGNHLAELVVALLRQHACKGQAWRGAAAPSHEGQHACQWHKASRRDSTANPSFQAAFQRERTNPSRAQQPTCKRPPAPAPVAHPQTTRRQSS